MAGGDTFSSATFRGIVRGYGTARQILPQLEVGVSFADQTEAGALAALVTPPGCYSLRATLSGTPVLQVWGGGGVQTLTIANQVSGEDALLIACTQDTWLPGGRSQGRATFLLTTNAAVP